MSPEKIQQKQAITDRLRQILDERSLSQRDFAAMIGKKESEVSRWLGGRFFISAATQARIEAALHESLSDKKDIKVNGIIRIGIIGTGSIARRFAKEAAFVNEVRLSAVFNPDVRQAERFAEEFGIAVICGSAAELFGHCDAVYVASPLSTHFSYASSALENGCHVLCEMPFTESAAEAEMLYRTAAKNNLIILPALKTAYCPSFLQMIVMARSGIIGNVVDISSTVTNLLPADTPEAFSNERMLENISYPVITTLKIFGSDWKKLGCFNRWNGGKLLFTSTDLEYDNSISSFKVGVGVKSEGSLVISGTGGYIYVPAPWWKMDYFEVRFENPADNKKYFFPYEADGLRYEITALCKCILRTKRPIDYISRKEIIGITGIQNRILRHK